MNAQTIEKKLRALAEKLGVKFEENGSDITLIGTDEHTWSSTGTHDLFVEIGEFPNRTAALKALLDDAELGFSAKKNLKSNK